MPLPFPTFIWIQFLRLSCSRKLKLNQTSSFSLCKKREMAWDMAIVQSQWQLNNFGNRWCLIARIGCYSSKFRANLGLKNCSVLAIFFITDSRADRFVSARKGYLEQNTVFIVFPQTLKVIAMQQQQPQLRLHWGRCSRDPIHYLESQHTFIPTLGRVKKQSVNR